MSTDVLVEILNLLRNHENISVKIELSTTSDSTVTTIKLKEVQRPSRKTTGYPEVKKERRKKNPCRARRDAKRRETYLARKAGSGTASSGLVSSSSPVLEADSTPRRTVTPRRRLDTTQNTGNAEPGPALEKGGVENEKLCKRFATLPNQILLSSFACSKYT